MLPINFLVTYLLPTFEKKGLGVFQWQICGIMKVRELVRLLYDDGWVTKEQKGSHLQLIHPTKKGKITVPVHGGDIPKGTLHAILKQAGLK
jgi:predicted RNA binding protein YcfA (HicA-like mRNA interferase family)